MIAYFTASIVGKKHHLVNYLKIISFLRSKKINVICDHIVGGSEQKISLQTKDERIKFHKTLEKWIGSSDFVVVETTFPSISVGYEISLALQLNKTVLLLYSQGDPPSLFGHHKNPNIICEKYTPATLNDIIDDFINFSQDKADCRFTFFITPEINKFLEDISRKQKLPKSVYLRRLIEKEMTS